MSKKIVIIGGGIAGLSAGVYGRMNGYDTEIYEMHSIAGGLCTAWNRKGYTFDGCVHWLTGSSPGTEFHELWRETGALKGGDVVEHDEFVRLYDENGDETIFYTDLDKLCAELKRVSPEDERPIEELRRLVLALSDSPFPIRISEVMSFWDQLKTNLSFLPYLKDILSTISIPVIEFIERFKSSRIRELFKALVPQPDFPAYCLIFTLIIMNKRTAGWPLGGSLKFAESILEKYTSMGGKIFYGKRAEKILTNKSGAYAALMADGSRVEGDLIISAADGYSTIFKMLEGRYLNKKIEHYYNSFKLFTPFIQVSLGVDADMSKLPHCKKFMLEKGHKIGRTAPESLFVTHYCFDPSMAPAGKSSVVFLIYTPWEIWEKIKYNSEEYNEEKEAIEHDIRLFIKEKMPEIYNKIEVIDVATPHTTVRYTANRQGSFQGFLPTVKNLTKPLGKMLPGLKRFYMIGQWTSIGGGLPIAARDGRDIIELICKKDRKKFVKC